MRELKDNDIQKMVEYAWLQLDWGKVRYDKNPLQREDPKDFESPETFLVNIIRNLDYLPFTCKHIFNINILPFQFVVLKELFIRSFPMMIFNRGASKCVKGSSLIPTDKGFFRIDEIIKEPIQSPIRYSVLGINGLKKPEYGWSNNLNKTVRIITQLGYEIEGTFNHPIKVYGEGKNLIWRELKDVGIGDEIPLLTNGYVFGDNIEYDEISAFNLGREFTQNEIPLSIRTSPADVIKAFIYGILLGKNGFITESAELAKQLQTIMLAFGIISKRELRNDISSVLYQKHSASTYHVDSVQKIEFDAAITYDLHIPQDHTFISNGFISHNSFLLGLYSLLKCLLVPDSRVVIVGAGFRQSKLVFEYIERIWNNAPVCRDLFGPNSSPHRDPDRWLFKLGSSTIKSLPIGPDGSKIRGERATVLIADEFSSMIPEVFETVISGFGAVSQDPFSGVKSQAKETVLKDLGLWTDTMEIDAKKYRKSNQAIIAGTASYSFNHFYSYWLKWKKIVNSRGDPHVLEEVFTGNVPKAFDWRDYSVMRFPYDLLPDGFMDAKTVARSKATMLTQIYQNEFLSCFSTDTQGFFKRSLIESCVTKEPITINGRDIQFEARMKGDKDLQYVYGIDPASESDNFAICIIELHKDHKRVVYCWTSTRKTFRDRKDQGLVKENDFYVYCVRKIRSLMKVFPCQKICLDKQGGGVAILEGLRDTDKIELGEFHIYEVVDPEKEKESDFKEGLHIIEIAQFAKADWVLEANTLMRKDMEDRVLLFPFNDAISLVLAEETDKKLGLVNDSLRDCVFEIEELKDELTLIVQTQTATGRDRFSTPDVKTGGVKGRMKKDRYSALLMANLMSRDIQRADPVAEYKPVGGWAKTTKASDGRMYYGPDWYKAHSNLFKAVKR